MNERPEVDAQLFAEHVSAIMSGLATAPATREGGRAIDGTAAMSSLLYVIAAMIEAHPDLGDDDHLQAAGADVAVSIEGYLRQLRAESRSSGTHAWDAMNVPLDRRH